MRVLITDDHSIMRKGLVTLLGGKYNKAQFDEATSGAEAIEKTRTQKYDIILMDISMPGKNGVETLKQLRADGIKTPVIILTMQREDQYAIRALKAGANGYVNKECAYEELIAAVDKALEGKIYLSESLSQKLALSFTESGGKLPHETLSDREMQVLELIASGKSLSETAVAINLSVNTISTYRARILEKLSLTTTAEMIRYAIDNKLV